MHSTTIVQNKILSIICSCLFFCPHHIYSPSLGKVRLGKPNPNQHNSLNFYLKRKKTTFYLELYTQHLASDFQFSFSFIFKKYIKCIKKPVKMFNYIYNNFFF